MGRVELRWNPFDLTDPGPCIDVTVMNSPDVLERWGALGLEFPKPISMRALLDTGASVTAISQTFANHCKLFQTSTGFEITAIGARHSCGEHAGSISFPGTNLRSLDSIRIISVVFVREPSYACLLGRDILRNWNITFDGRSNKVTITD